MPALFALFLVFLTLRLTETVAWSWLWITVPLWGPFAAVAGLFLFGLLLAAVSSIAGSRGNYFTAPLGRVA